MIGRSRRGQVVVSAPPGARRGDARDAPRARPTRPAFQRARARPPPVPRRRPRPRLSRVWSDGPTEREEKREERFFPPKLSRKRGRTDGRTENPPVCCCFFFTPVSCCHATSQQAAPVSGGVVKSAIRESTVHLQSNVRTWT